MNPGPAPRPPTDRPKVSLTPQVYPSSNGSGGLSSFPGATPIGSSASLARIDSNLNGDMTVVKDGTAKVKEEGGTFLMKAFWLERFLVLREKQLDFLKNNQTNKTMNTIPLREITHITRSDNYPFSLELTREDNKMWILKFETDAEVYSWMESINDRCPSMGGVSRPTGFSHRVHVGFDPVTGGFIGLPVEWERLLKGSALTQDDVKKNPQAVMEVLQFYTDKLAVRAEDPKMYSSLTPTPSIDANKDKQLGYGNGVAPPRPAPPTSAYSNGSRSPAGTPGSGYSSSRDQSNDRYGAPKSNAAPIQSLDPRLDDERRKQQEEQKRRLEAERRRIEEEQERKRRQEEDREYNDSIPKTKTPLAKQELGGYGASESSPSARYNPTRPAPPAPGKAAAPSGALPLRNLQAQRAAPSAPSQPGKHLLLARIERDNDLLIPGKPAVSAVRKDEPAAAASKTAAAGQVKPLNVTAKAPTTQVKDPIKQAEMALTKKEEKSNKEVRMSAMSDAQVMERLRSVVSLSNPLESYNKQKKIGQGASGSVYVARIRENAPSPIAKDLIKTYGPRAQVAIKQMDLRSQPRKELIVNEIIVMKESRHDNIVNFLDAFLQEETFELWVVMEFMEGGALTDVIDNNNNISEEQIARICLEVSYFEAIHLGQCFNLLTSAFTYRLARVSFTFTLSTLFIVTSNLTTSSSPLAAPSKSPISDSVPSSQSSGLSVRPWSVRLTGWHPKWSSRRSTAARSTSGLLVSWPSK
jgi:protein-serine/threonine kinase